MRTVRLKAVGCRLSECRQWTGAVRLGNVNVDSSKTLGLGSGNEAVKQ